MELKTQKPKETENGYYSLVPQRNKKYQKTRDKALVVNSGRKRTTFRT